ncbi:hypothetical protein HAX54_025103 [Datura stramonium]|uniref:Uncharacterized protein n=1 Tax=Datura stramonium TaxID=4076 RepID=A0ABS8V1B5_DATST|nr:hypothetical protein [Datura stramonium]
MQIVVEIDHPPWHFAIVEVSLNGTPPSWRLSLCTPPSWKEVQHDTPPSWERGQRDMPPLSLSSEIAIGNMLMLMSPLYLDKIVVPKKSTEKKGYSNLTHLSLAFRNPELTLSPKAFKKTLLDIADGAVSFLHPRGTSSS